MPSDLSNYLASKYLVADAKPKTRKRKHAAADGGLLITDDDAGWGKTAQNDEDIEDGPVTVTGASAEFRRTKKSNWKSLSGDAAARDTDDAATADAILASAAAETAAARAEDEEMPLIEDDANVVKINGWIDGAVEHTDLVVLPPRAHSGSGVVNETVSG
ncbi:hypothetical protein NQ176_g490 [Zarea fungicola]|uniref:Uncharacterized protein n=1 Tax=Zarea fungicola TaxID=93591 RepID=A0ACC1NWT4_9HYPO|nr:hypothetical protein NQ176_g490 [Lecanicillium fungicola]